MDKNRTETPKKEYPNSINYSEIDLCKSFIKDAIIELETYEKLHKLPKITISSACCKSLEEKFGTLVKPVEKLHEENAESRSLIKLQEDRTYLEIMLRELLKNDHFDKLISEHEKCKDEEDTLLRDLKNVCVKQKRLENEIEEAGVQQSLLWSGKDEETGNLKDEYENLLREFRIKEAYVEKWEESRQEQLETRLQQKEKVLENTIRDLKNRTVREKRVHQEIQAYDNVVIQDHNDAIVYWTEKYEKDLKLIEEKIEKTKNAKLTQHLKTTAISALFKEREKEMEMYKELKELERLKMEEIVRINGEATKIQAWWRGVMVRRKLGPYKVKKPKPKGKGKSGKST